MGQQPTNLAACVLIAASLSAAAEPAPWWNPQWRCRTTVLRATPYRDAGPRPVEVVVDFPRLLERAGIRGEFDPASVRVVERGGGPIPFAQRAEFDARQARHQSYLAWMARPRVGDCGSYDLYFDTKDRGIQAEPGDAALLPPENLIANPGFEEALGDSPAAWKAEPPALARLGRFEHTTGKQSLKIVVDDHTPADIAREFTVSQRIDVRRFAGQEMVFECDLMAERAQYGAPVSIELQQFRADGSRIPDFAVQPRWLTMELAPGQLVQFSERGKFNPETATVNVCVRARCLVRDADTGQTVTGPEAHFTLWLDRLVVRPGERWMWPAASHGGFVEGALANAPLNRAFEFTGQRRLAFNGASEGTLTGNLWGDARSVHWGLEAGTLEFWCRPHWNVGDGVERVFFEGVAYGHRLQSRLRKLDGREQDQLEFTIADADAKPHTIRGPASLRAGQWHHIAATWNLPKAQLQLFVDGQRMAAQGPGTTPWPCSLVPDGDPKFKGMGISEDDRRSLPMQAFIGGDRDCRAEGAANAALDEVRLSDVARYGDAFVPGRDELAVDEHTRALFHFENERHGVHAGDDRFVHGHLLCELPPQQETAPLEILAGGGIERRHVVVKPHPPAGCFEAHRAEGRLPVTRPFRDLPDPRFVEYRLRKVERVVTGRDDGFDLEVGGDYAPWMLALTYEHADGASTVAAPLPHWRANDNVVPVSVETLAATLAPDAAGDEQRAFEVFRYALETSNYYDAHYCETLPARHRPRVSYTLLKALNIFAFDQCGPLNYTLRKLFLAAGLSSTDASGTHHQFEQAFYGGSWRLFDLSPRLFWLDRDDATIVGRRGLEDDLYLKIRQGGDPRAWLPGRKSRASFGTAERPHDMTFLLRPGERASLCWHNEGRWFELAESRQPIPLAKIPPYFGNGAIVYTPTARGDAARFDNLAVETSADDSTRLRAKDALRPAALIYRAQCPYILTDASVTGRCEARDADAVSVSLSFDEGKNWTPAWRSPARAGDFAVNLRDHVTARYAYWLKLELAAGRGATVSDLQVRSTLACSPLALAGKLEIGTNRIRFVGPPSVAPIKTACRWVERHRSDFGVSLNSISYYLNGDAAHRNLLVVAPDGELPVEAATAGRRLEGEVSAENLPAGWTVKPGNRLVIRASGSKAGDIRAFEVVIRNPTAQRRLPVQVLVADAALAREAEKADALTGAVRSTKLPEASGGRVASFSGSGSMVFNLNVPQMGRYALWLRAKYEDANQRAMTLAVDDSKPRELRATAMIGFTDWTGPRQAHTKMFAHFGEQYGHWSWYRIPDVDLTAGKHWVTLGGNEGASLDALVLLPQNDTMDRAAMNLFQNWNYAPWANPL